MVKQLYPISYPISCPMAVGSQEADLQWCGPRCGLRCGYVRFNLIFIICTVTRVQTKEKTATRARRARGEQPCSGHHRLISSALSATYSRRDQKGPDWCVDSLSFHSTVYKIIPTPTAAVDLRRRPLVPPLSPLSCPTLLPSCPPGTPRPHACTRSSPRPRARTRSHRAVCSTYATSLACFSGQLPSPRRTTCSSKHAHSRDDGHRG